jgi:hypothetical protein
MGTEVIPAAVHTRRALSVVLASTGTAIHYILP